MHIVAIGLGLWMTTAASAVQGPAPTEKDHFENGEVVPVFTLKTVNVEESGVSYVGVDAYYGPTAKEPKKAVLLSFFATYCEPCKREMPFLAALYDAYKDKGLAVLSVSIDKEAEKIDFIKNLAKASQVKFPVLSDRFNIVAKRYMIARLPCVYLINGDGKVALVNVGYNDDLSRQLLDEIRKVLGEPATEPLPEPLKKYLDSRAAASVPDATAKASNNVGGGDDSADAKGKKKAKKQKGKKKTKS